MGKQRQIRLTSNTAEQDISGSEALINVYPSESTGGKYEFNLLNTPGLGFYCELPTYPILGMYENGSRAFAATPSKLYEVYNNGDFKELGDIKISGRAIFADNGLQVVLVDGFKGYYYDISTEEVNQITSDAFYPSRTVTYQDGYFVFERKDTGQFFLSDLLSVNFDATRFATAEAQPDNLVSVISDHRELFLFGTDTTEVWYNNGSSTFAFARNQAAFIEKGCAAPYSVAKQNNTVFFIGSDLRVYSLTGYVPVPISSNAVEKTLKNVDLSDAFAYTYQNEGHLFYVLTIPANNITWSFDVSTGAWHIMKSYNFKRHNAGSSIFFNFKTLIGDFQSGRIYVMDSGFYTADKEPIVKEFVLPTVSFGREFVSVASFELDMRSGVGLVSGQGSDPIVYLSFSKDDGKTWSNLKEGKIGKIGEYLTRVKWNRLGSARQFIFKIRTSEPIPIDIGGAYIEVS